MDFSSFDLSDSTEQPTQSLISLDVETFGQDASAFFDFIDSSDFNSISGKSGTDQQQKQQQQEQQQPSHIAVTHSNAINHSSSPLTKNTLSLMSPINTDSFSTPSQQPINVDFLEDEEFLTPLVSPAIPPNCFDSLRNDTNFSPLTSPALRPQTHESIGYQLEGYQINTPFSTQQDQLSEELQEQLAVIERQQQQLRSHLQQSSPSATSSTSSSASSSPVHKSIVYGNAPYIAAPSSVSKPKQQTLRHKIAMSSPKFNPVTHLRSPGIHPQVHNNTLSMAPATPSLLMKLGNDTQQHSSPSHDSVIDTMMVLPDAMLPPADKQSSTTHHKTTNMHKRRRISYPRSAFTPPALLPSYPNAALATVADQNIAALISPAALRPHPPPLSVMVSPKPNGNDNGSMTSSPRALKPFISPSLQPKGHVTTINEQQAATILAAKSNYQALREGQAKSLGIDFSTTTIPSGMDHRRSAHKAAEQRRRDTLKQCFDALRGELLESIVAEDLLQQQEECNGDQDAKSIHNQDDGKVIIAATPLEREKKVKQMSKVVLLQHSYEYLLRLKSDNQRKGAKLEQMTKEIQQLRSRLGMAPMTEQERQAEAEEKQEQKKNWLARLKQLEDMAVDT